MCLAMAAGWMALACRERSARQELIEAYGEVRPVEGRLTGGLAYVPYKLGTDSRPSSLKAVRRAERRILAKGKRRSPQSLGDLALVELLAGDPDNAVALLEQAVAKAPGDALLRSDLTAAYIARAGNGAKPYDYVRALAAADQALRIDPHLQEARFNRALALEKLPLEDVARRAWQETLARESGAEWRAEEQFRLQALSGPGAVALWNSERERLEEAASRGDKEVVATIVARFPCPAKLYVEEDLLARWAEQMSQGQWNNASRTLHIARAIGTALVQLGADPMVRDAVAAIAAATAAPSAKRLRHLVEGHRRYGTGLAFYKGEGRSREPDRAVQELAAAARHLRLGGTPFAGWATLYLASSEYSRARLEPARAVLESLRQNLPDDRYPSLEGRITLILASIDLLRGHPGEALPRLLEGRLLFLKSGDDEDLSSTLQHLVRAYRLLGETDDAWRYLREGLHLTARLQSYRRVAAIFEEAGLAAQDEEHPEVAFYFQNETLARALRVGDPETIAAARRRRALTLLRTGRTGEAREEIATAQRVASQIPNESLRRRLASEILMARAEIDLASDPLAASSFLTTAIRYFESGQYRLYLPLANFLRARARLAGGDEPGAEADFRAGLAEIETARTSLGDPRLRIALYDQAAALFDETLAVLARRGEAEEAFLLSEQGRARQLLESLAVASLSTTPGPVRPDRLLAAREIRRELPPGTVLVKYTALEDRLLVWSLGRERESFRQIPIRRADLERVVARARAGLLAGNDRRSLPELRQLYGWLVAPVEADLDGAREIVFVPDRALCLLPFAALVVPRTGRYLVEERALGVAPSANVYVRCLRRLRHGAGKPGSALVVGAADFDRQRFPSLVRLDQVASEVTLVARQYARHWLLTGSGATRERFFTELAERQPEVLHFAGHTVLNPSSPELSMLLLAPGREKTDSGAVYSHEIYGLRPGRLRLVVLSACETAAGKLSTSEGAMGLTRPFLAAGVPTVVASLGAVQDGDSRAILTLFHQRLQAGDTPAEALRAAQRSRIARDGRTDAPGRWALFEVIGASAPFREENHPWPSR